MPASESCNRLLGQKQHNQSEEDAAGVKSPGQQHPSNQSAIVQKAEGGQSQRQPAGIHEHRDTQKQSPAWDEQGLQGRFAPHAHSMTPGGGVAGCSVSNCASDNTPGFGEVLAAASFTASPPPWRRVRWVYFKNLRFFSPP